MRNILFLFFALSAVYSFAQPSVSATTKWQVMDGNDSWIATALQMKTYMAAGTVTSFSSGDMNPLFTTSVATATTTPALSFTLSNAGANTYFGNSTGSTSTPTHSAAGALTKTDDTNVTLTLGGNPSKSLLQSTSLTLGWTGTLAASRGGTGLGSLGAAKSILRVNSAGTAMEFSATQSIGTGLAVGTTSDPAASAVLDIVSTTKGFGLPQMTSAQKEAISAPRDGLEVWDTDLDGKCVYDGVKWVRLCQRSTPSVSVGAGAGTGASATVTGNDIQGIVTLTTGTTPTTSAVLFTVTWNDSYSTAPIAVMMTGNSNNAANLPGGRIPYVSSVGTTTFVASNPSINGLADATVYVFNYRTIQ